MCMGDDLAASRARWWYGMTEEEIMAMKLEAKRRVEAEIGKLVSAVSERANPPITRIPSLEARIAELEADVADLKARLG